MSKEKQTDFSPEDGSFNQEKPDTKRYSSDSNSRPRNRRSSNKPFSNTKRNQKNLSDTYSKQSNSITPYAQRSGRYFNTDNFSLPVIAQEFSNQSIVTGAIIDGRSITVRYTVVIKKNRLEAQASVWAKRIISEHRLYLKSILNVYPNQYESVLTQMYIYSYFRCVLYAINDRRVVDIPLNQVNIAGHAILRHCLLVSSHTFSHGQVNIQYLLDVSDEEYDAILTMARSYPFINDYMRTSPRFFIENAELDRCFDGLYRDTNMSDGPKLFRHDSDANDVLSALTRDKFPILNSIYKKDGLDSQWYYAYTEKERITDGSMLFGKACFISEKGDDVIQNYFSSVSVDDDYRVTKYEVSSLTGTWYPEYIPKQDAGK